MYMHFCQRVNVSDHIGVSTLSYISLGVQECTDYSLKSLLITSNGHVKF